MELALLGPNDKFFQYVASRMRETIVDHDNRVGLVGYNIEKVYQVKNCALKELFEKKKKEIEEKTGKQSDIWEAFHGSPAALNIAKSGFDMTHTSNGSMFGRGFYFSPLSSKANQYTIDRRFGCYAHNNWACTTCTRSMLLCLCIMGNKYEPRGPIKNVPAGYHSVVAMPTWNPDLVGTLRYPEHCVLHKDQVLPFALVEYTMSTTKCVEKAIEKMGCTSDIVLNAAGLGISVRPVVRSDHKYILFSVFVICTLLVQKYYWPALLFFVSNIFYFNTNWALKMLVTYFRPVFGTCLCLCAVFQFGIMAYYQWYREIFVFLSVIASACAKEQIRKHLSPQTKTISDRCVWLFFIFQLVILLKNQWYTLSVLLILSSCSWFWRVELHDYLKLHLNDTLIAGFLMGMMLQLMIMIYNGLYWASSFAILLFICAFFALGLTRENEFTHIGDFVMVTFIVGNVLQIFTLIYYGWYLESVIILLMYAAIVGAIAKNLSHDSVAALAVSLFATSNLFGFLILLYYGWYWEIIATLMILALNIEQKFKSYVVAHLEDIFAIFLCVSYVFSIILLWIYQWHWEFFFSIIVFLAICLEDKLKDYLNKRI